jgi:predicted transcriptional regulator
MSRTCSGRPARSVKLGDQVKAARLDKGLSLAGGAHVLGVEPEELYELERGGYSFAIQDVLAMLRG